MILPPILPDRKPTTMEVIGYQRVQHALSDGKPDLAAPDNFYIRTTTKWYLSADSQNETPDADGSRHFHLPERNVKSYVLYDSQGRASKSLLAKFSEVNFDHVRLRRPILDGGGWSRGPIDFKVDKGQRFLYFDIRSVAEKVETHTEGKRRLTRVFRQAIWCGSTQGWHVDKPFIPDLEPRAAFEPLPHVQVDPPVFGYGEFVKPKDDEF